MKEQMSDKIREWFLACREQVRRSGGGGVVGAARRSRDCHHAPTQTVLSYTRTCARAHARTHTDAYTRSHTHLLTDTQIHTLHAALPTDGQVP